MIKCTKKISDECKAICQMNVLNVLFLGGGMDIGQAIIELGLIDPKCAHLADMEGFDMVAFNIRKALNAKGQWRAALCPSTVVTGYLSFKRVGTRNGVGKEQEKMEINVIIPGTPIAKKRPRFARRGKFVTTYNDQETEEGKFILLAMQQIKRKAPPGEPVSLACLFVFPYPTSLSKKRRREIEERGGHHVKKPDADNCLKFVKDCLNGVAWHDDSQVSSVVAEKRYGTDARTELIIRWESRFSCG